MPHLEPVIPTELQQSGVLGQAHTNLRLSSVPPLEKSWDSETAYVISMHRRTRSACSQVLHTLTGHNGSSVYHKPRQAQGDSVTGQQIIIEVVRSTTGLNHPKMSDGRVRLDFGATSRSHADSRQLGTPLDMFESTGARRVSATISGYT